MNKISTIIIDTDKNSLKVSRENIEECKFANIIGEFNEYKEGYRAVIQQKPAIVYVDISENEETAFEIIEKISLKLPSALIAVASYDSEPQNVIKVIKAGAREFIKKPVDKIEIKAVFDKFKQIFEAGSINEKESKVFTVFSNKGGLGKTTVATNLAVALADVTKEKVALIDLNLQLGDVTTFLDMTPSFDISYVVSNLDRLDEDFLKGTLDRYKNKQLYVLADPPYLEQAEEMTAEQISSVIKMMKTVFKYIVIDTGNNFDSKTIGALDVSDSILLLSMVNLPCIRNAQRCMDLFNRLGYDEDKVKLIVNRYVEDDDIKIEDVEEVLNHPVYWKIPNNYGTLMGAINKGIPVVDIAPDANISISFKHFASNISNVIIDDMNYTENNNKQSGFWGLIKKFFSRPKK